jgi:hypothetical protein
MILKHPVDLSKTPLRIKEGDGAASCFSLPILDAQQSYEFFKYLVRVMVSVLNNIGAIYVMRNKFVEGAGYFTRAVTGRMYDFDSYVALYQAGLIETNVLQSAGSIDLVCLTAAGEV